jgi:BA14K-like protein
MLNKYSTLVLGAMLGLGTLAFTGTGASAAAMLPLSAVASGSAHVVQGGIIQVDHKNKKWKNKNWHKKHFNYCNDWNGGCHNYRRRHDFDGSHLFLPLIIGGIAANNYYNDDYDDYDDYADGGGLGSRHVQYCLNKYRSYKPRYNTWVAFSGQVKKCYSPYM